MRCAILPASAHLSAPAMSLHLASIVCRLSVALLLSTLGASTAMGQSWDERHVAAIDSIAEGALEGTLAGVPPVAGLSIGVAQDGVPVLMRGYGMADLDATIPATDSTIFRIGSLTKTFTASVVLQLVDEGRLALEDDIRTYVPGAPTHGQRVTIAQLLNHTSGIPSYTNRPEYPWQTAEARSHDEMLGQIAGDSLDFAPGAAYSYTNSGYYLLGLLIEERTGRSYAEALRARLFEPLGLTDTQYCPDAPDGPTHAQGYRPSPFARSPQPASAISMTQPFAAGALCSSVRDLLAWMAALQTGAVLSDALYEAMRTPTITTAGDMVRYGYGLQATERFGRAYIGHGGGINGFAAQWGHFPEEGWTLVVLANTEGTAAFQVEEAIARLLLNAAPATQPMDLGLSAEERRPYEGTYAIGPLNIRVFSHEEVLWAQGDGQPAFRLMAQGGGVFLAHADPSIRLVFTRNGETASELTLHRGRQLFQGPRLDDE